MRAPLFAAAAVLLMPFHAYAQADPAVTAETERIKAETDLEKAKTERVKADSERLTALGIPKFEGKTEIGAGGGTMEATLLSAQALGAAADAIARVPALVQRRTVVVLTRDEALDLGLAASIDFEMQTINALYARAKVDDPSLAGGGVGAAAMITAVAGLLRSDTTVSYADVAAIDDRMLAWTVSRGLGARAVLPSAKIGGALGTKGTALIKAFNLLEQRRDLAVAPRDRLAAIKAPSAAEKRELANLNAAITRHDAFVARVSAASDKGVIPLVAAARLADLLASGNAVLRLHVDKAGGSLVNSKNIATFLGADPLRISGGLVASWALTDPETGNLLAADVLTCRTTSATITRIQRFADGTTGSRCASVLRAAPGSAS